MPLDEAIARELAVEVAPLLARHLSKEAEDPCYRPAKAAEYLGVSPRALKNLELPVVYPTPGLARYRLSTLNRHIENGIPE